MIVKPGDVVWSKTLNSKCVVDKIHSVKGEPEHYDVLYVREINKGKPHRSGVVASYRVKVSDISQYLVCCPICGKNIRVLSGLLDSHSTEDGMCYGSYLPLK